MSANAVFDKKSHPSRLSSVGWCVYDFKLSDAEFFVCTQNVRLCVGKASRNILPSEEFAVVRFIAGKITKFEIITPYMIDVTTHTPLSDNLNFCQNVDQNRKNRKDNC